MDVPTPGWVLAGIVHGVEAFDIGGINPWDVKWSPIGRITVVDPVYPPKQDEIIVYEAEGVTPRVVFAADEYSNGVWCFFVPTSKESRWRRYKPFGPAPRPLSDP